MPVSIRQIHPVFVGEVSGVDITKPLTPAGRGGHRRRHGQVCRAGVPRPEAHRRAADGVHAQLRRHRGCARRQRHEAPGQAPGHRHERRLQPRQGRQAAAPRQPPAAVQPRQHALALRQLVPGHPRQVFAAVRPGREQEGRQYRVRRTWARPTRRWTRRPGARSRTWCASTPSCTRAGRWASSTTPTRRRRCSSRCASAWCAPTP